MLSENLKKFANSRKARATCGRASALGSSSWTCSSWCKGTDWRSKNFTTNGSARPIEAGCRTSWSSRFSDSHSRDPRKVPTKLRAISTFIENSSKKFSTSSVNFVRSRPRRLPVTKYRRAKNGRGRKNRTRTRRRESNVEGRQPRAHRVWRKKRPLNLKRHLKSWKTSICSWWVFSITEISLLL